MKLDFGQILTLIAIITGGWLIFRIPSSYMNGYVQWVHEKHGAMVNISFGFLLLATAPGIFLILTEPGKYPLIEIVSVFAASTAVIASAWDNYRFWKARYRQLK